MPLSSVRWFGQLIHWRADCTLWTAPFAIFCRHDSCDSLAPPPGITNFQQGRSFSSKPKLLDQKPPYLCPRMSTAPQRQPLCQNSHRATTGDHVTIKMAAARQRHFVSQFAPRYNGRPRCDPKIVAVSHARTQSWRPPRAKKIFFLTF